MSRKSRREYLAGGVAAALAMAGCLGTPTGTGPGTSEDGTTDDETTDEDATTRTDDDPRAIDDWQYEPPSEGEHKGNASGGSSGGTVTQVQTTAAAANGKVGYSAGGAKDVNNFRQNVEEGYLPIPTDVSYEGLFYDYYFDTGSSGTCTSLFCPSYSTAVSADPLSDETERYLTVGLNSGITDFERKPLNLVVVLDVSGSMGSGFGEYYYDQAGNEKEIEEPEKPKIEVAQEAVADLTRQLWPEDRFGMVTFNDDAQVAKPLHEVEATDMDAIRGHMDEIVASGGTRMSGGIETATEMLSEYGDRPKERETRMVVVTDAMPNLGETDDEDLRGTLADNADENLFSTFVGVGVDFNTEIIDRITAIRGANYYSVKSPEQFETRLSDEFEYMVTPLVFDLSVEFQGSGYEVQKVYGSTAAEESTGEVLKVNTLFPSPTSDGKTKGGVVLAKVRKTGDGGDLQLKASWEDRAGKPGSRTKSVQFGANAPEFFANSGIRKAVLLTRYADLIKNWTIDERERNGDPKTDGIRVPPEDRLGEWERQSTDLQVSSKYRQRFDAFADYFAGEMDALGDDALSQELAILRKLADYGESRLVGSSRSRRRIDEP